MSDLILAIIVAEVDKIWDLILCGFIVKSKIVNKK